MSGRKTVLVLEDDPFVSMDLEMIVADVLSADVRVTASVAAAREALRSGVDLALLDVDVEDGKSYPIAEALMSRDTPFIFVSGSEALHLPPPLRSVPFVAKPYAPQAMEAAIRSSFLAGDGS